MNISILDTTPDDIGPHSVYILERPMAGVWHKFANMESRNEAMTMGAKLKAHLRANAFMVCPGVGSDVILRHGAENQTKAPAIKKQKIAARNRREEHFAKTGEALDIGD